MFDPTAFENMKVVLEGALYDLDMDGEITITDRNDFINIAKLSRKYEIYFKIAQLASRVTARLVLEAGLENLAAELLSSPLSEVRSGCFIYLVFSFEQKQKIIDYDKIDKLLLDIWGANRKITHSVLFYPLQKEKKMYSEILIEFERLVHEEQLNDLAAMIDVMISTLYRLHDL